MNTLKIAYLSLLILFGTLSFTSCGNDDDIVIPEEPEVITSLTYTLTSTSGNTAVLSFQDLDGDGGNAPILTAQDLSANTTYTAALTLSNESTTPTEDITTEIEEEKEEHQFFISSDVPGLSVTYNDTDANGQPVGLSTTLTTGDAGTGTLRIILRHEPNKSAEGVANGDVSNAGGETDIEVVFDVVVI